MCEEATGVGGSMIGAAVVLGVPVVVLAINWGKLDVHGTYRPGGLLHSTWDTHANTGASPDWMVAPMGEDLDHVKSTHEIQRTRRFTDLHMYTIQIHAAANSQSTTSGSNQSHPPFADAKVCNVCDQVVKG